MFQPCHPHAGLSDGWNLWLHRVSQVCRRGSAGLHRLLNILRPYGALLSLPLRVIAMNEANRRLASLNAEHFDVVNPETS